MLAPIAPKPSSIIAQVEGSGTAELKEKPPNPGRELETSLLVNVIKGPDNLWSTPPLTIGIFAEAVKELVRTSAKFKDVGNIELSTPSRNVRLTL